MKSGFRKVRRCALVSLLFTGVLCVLPLIILLDLVLAGVVTLLIWTGHAEGAEKPTVKDFGKFFTQNIPEHVRQIFHDFRNAFKEACQ